MINQELNRLYHQLDDIQQKYMLTLKAQASSLPSAFDRVQMLDMVQLIQMDIQNREQLEEVSDMIPRVALSESMYDAFLQDMATILLEFAGCTIPHEIAYAYKSIGDAVKLQDKLDPRDIFTCISITLIVIALCITQMPLARQQEVLGLLDHLLEIKKSQLELLEETARFHKDFADRNPFV